jgi:hypothetical protein
MSIETHRIVCGKRGKNPSQPINSPFTGTEKSRSESRHGYRRRAIDLFPIPRVARVYLSPLSTYAEHIGMYQTGDMSGGNPQPPLH